MVLLICVIKFSFAAVWQRLIVTLLARLQAYEYIGHGHKLSFLKPPFEQENARQENSSPHFSVRHFPVQKAQSIPVRGIKAIEWNERAALAARSRNRQRSRFVPFHSLTRKSRLKVLTPANIFVPVEA
jgi:hypothetical protein